MEVRFKILSVREIIFFNKGIFGVWGGSIIISIIIIIAVGELIWVECWKLNRCLLIKWEILGGGGGIGGMFKKIELCD